MRSLRPEIPAEVLALMVCVFGVTTGEFVIAGILPDVAAGLNVSISAAGLLVTAYAVGMIIGGPVLTALTSRAARKPLLVVLLVVAVAGNAASALAPTYTVLFAARMVTALVTATFFANAIVIAASSAAPGKQASTVSTLVFGMNLSMILGAPIGTLIGTAFGWRATFAAIAACCALGLVLVLRLVPDARQTGPASSAVAELRVFRSRDVQLAIAVTAAGSTGLLAVFTYFAPLLTDVAGFATATVPVLLLVYGVGAAAGTVVGGRLSDRAPAASQLALLTALAASFVLMWAVGASTPAAAVLVFVIGALGFSIVPGMQTRVLASATAAPTLAIAVNASAYQLAAAFGAWLGGAVATNGPGLPSIYLAGAAVTLVGVVLSGYASYRDRGAVSVEGQAEPA